MEIKLDDTSVQDAINSQLGRAVGDALGGYDVKRAIEVRMTASIAHGIIGEAVDIALKGLDVNNLAAILGAQIARAVTGSTVRILTEGFIEILLNIKKIPEYDHEKRERARQEILADITRSKEAKCQT